MPHSTTDGDALIAMSSCEHCGSDIDGREHLEEIRGVTKAVCVDCCSCTDTESGGEATSRGRLRRALGV